ncbi:MAG TPA: hypothetical protein PKL52_08650 [Tenuifilaceae bacterium]|nr:hypothetical protein [Tenuifilaceae bacterium]
MVRFIVVICIAIFTQNSIAQTRSAASLQFALDHIEVGLEHNLVGERVVGHLFAGIANQNLPGVFRNYTFRIGAAYTAYGDSQNQICVNGGLGVYFFKHEQEVNAVPMSDIGVRYSHTLKRLPKHGGLVQISYRCGRARYKQQFSSDVLDIFTMSDFRVTPLHIAIGYLFKF